MADDEWNVERHLLGKPPEVVASYHHFTRLVSACGPFTYSIQVGGGAHLSGIPTPAMRP